MSPGNDAEGRKRIEAGLCYWCGASLTDEGQCPECGRRQTRVCFCGQELLPGEDPCPYCGADSTGIIKVRRRKRRRGVSAREMLGYVAAGVFVALLLAAAVNSTVGSLALRSADSTELPEAPSERLGLAWHTIQETFSAMASACVDRLGGLVPFVLMGVVGGLVGVLYYLRRNGGLGSRERDDYPEAEVKRRRRV